MSETPNHGYNVPSKGTTDWNVPLNENFEAHDTDIEVRDENAKKGEYEPKDGAKFLATDTGEVFVGDGDNWVPVESSGNSPALDQLSLGGDATVLGGSSKTFTVAIDDKTTLRVGPHEAKTFFTGEFTAPNVVNGHEDNEVADVIGATIGGGGAKNRTSGDSRSNRIQAKSSFATVSGGSKNRAGGFAATIGGGEDNQATGGKSTISGGLGNEATGYTSTVLGGYDNEASGDEATVGGGHRNTANGKRAAIPGGAFNTATGYGSFAAGTFSRAEHDGAFVWNTNSVAFESTGDDQFLVNAAGGVGLGTTAPKSPVDVRGENNWDLSNGEGDVRIGDDDHRLAIGVALDGGGAGACNVRAKGGIEKLNLGAGDTANSMTVDAGGATVHGDLDVTGNKNFAQAVETPAGPREVVYTATESPTPRTEVSGVATLADGRVEIDLPAHFAWVTSDDDPLVVQTTPYSADAGTLAAVERATDRVVVEDAEGGDYEFAYTVRGTRESGADKQVVRDARR